MNKALFATLDSFRLGKTQTAEKLISTVINNSLVLIIVKQDKSLTGHIINRRLQTAECKNSKIYAVVDANAINDGISILANLHWHKPQCHFLIGKKGLEEKIASACQASKEEIEILEKMFDSDILCYIEPLDEQLEFYADDLTKKIITDAFQSLLE